MATFVIDSSNRFVDPITGEVHQPKRVAKGGASEDRKEANQERNARRARQAVRRLARLNGLRYLTTVTFPGDGEHDFDRANRAISTFCRKRAQRLVRGRALTLTRFGGHPSI